MRHECCVCGYFKGYYTKAVCCYLREDCGYCSKKRQVVKKHETCENWTVKSYDSYERKTIVMQNLKDVLTKINVIEDFIKDGEQ